MGTLKTIPFSKLIATDSKLIEIRKEYSKKSAKQRRMAAQWQYDSEAANDILSTSSPLLSSQLGINNIENAGVIPLAIDPLYAPALLTVGSLEYQYKRIDEAMGLFLKLTELSPKEPDLCEIIDKAGDFLITKKDYNNALAIYNSAEKSFPKEGLYYFGSGFCLGKLNKFELAIEKYRIAISIEPDNYEYLNDFGYTLYEAGYDDEAIRFIKKAKDLSPPDYEFPENNLKFIQSELEKRKRKVPK